MKTLSLFDFGVGRGNWYFRFGALSEDGSTKAIFGAGLMGYRVYFEAFGFKPNDPAQAPMPAPENDEN